MRSRKANEVGERRLTLVSLRENLPGAGCCCSCDADESRLDCSTGFGAGWLESGLRYSDFGSGLASCDFCGCDSSFFGCSSFFSSLG